MNKFCNSVVIATLLIACATICAQSEQKLRQELIRQIDRKLRKIRSELIAEIDARLNTRETVYFGASFERIPPGIRILLNLPRNRAVLLAKVTANSPADKAGLQRLDIITKFAGKPVNNISHLRKLISRAATNKEIALSVLRNNKRIRLKIRLQRRVMPAPASARERDRQVVAELYKKLTRTKSRTETKPQKTQQKRPAKTEDVNNLLDDLLQPTTKKTNKTAKPYIGIKAGKIPLILRERENIPPGQGVLIIGGDNRHIKKWDILLAIDGKKVTSPDEYKRIIAGYKPGDRIRLLLISRGSRREVPIILKQR